MSESTKNYRDARIKKCQKLGELFSKSYYENVMSIQENDPTISRALLSLQMMFYYALETLILSFDEETENLQSQIMDDLEEVAHKDAEYQVDELKHRINQRLEAMDSISERQSEAIRFLQQDKYRPDRDDQ